MTRLARLGLGCWAFGGGLWRTQQRGDSIRTIHAAVRGGIRHYDTAQGYGKGVSEQMIGQQLRRFSREMPRAAYTLATKIHLPSKVEDLEPLVQLSLRRLCTPYVDILYIHWPDSTKELEPYLIELERIRSSGLCIHLGVSNFPSALMSTAMQYARISYCQIPVSLLWLNSLTDCARLCREGGIRIVGYSPLGLGLLSGAYRREDHLAPGDFRRRLYCYRKPYLPVFHTLLDSLETVSFRMGISCSEAALLWARMQPVDTILCGARTKAQMLGSLATDDLSVPLEAFDPIHEIATELSALIPQEEDNIFFHRW